MRAYGRKALIYILTFGGLIVVGFFMSTDNYSALSHNAVLLAIGFFSGNAVEHIAGALKK